VSIIISGLVTFCLMDIRIIIKHYQDFQTTENDYPYIDTIAFPLAFIEKAKPFIEGDLGHFKDNSKFLIIRFL